MATLISPDVRRSDDVPRGTPGGGGRAPRALPASLLRAGLVLADVTALMWAAMISGLPPVPTLAFVVTGGLFVATYPGRELNPRLSGDVTSLVGRLAVGVLLVAALAPGGVLPATVVEAGVIALPVLLLLRGVAYALLRRARARGVGLEPAVIVGAGPVGEAVARTLRGRAEFGLFPIGFVDDFEAASVDLPTLGRPDGLAAVLREHGVRTAIVAFGCSREAELIPVLRRCAALPLRLYALPRFFELGMGGDERATDDIWGFPLVRLRASPNQRLAWRAKRTLDVLAATLALALTAPLLGLAAIAVKVSSPGPIIFRQRRVGLLGEPIEVLKFRTMQVNDDGDVTWTVDDDERVTRVGHLLRRSHLDELPQLLNVLRGEMSLVGPRPERPHFAHLFSESIHRYDDRHRVPAGITGWSQVHGLWGDTSIEDRARFDNHYIENWSLWKDAVILVRTVSSVLARRADD